MLIVEPARYLMLPARLYHSLHQNRGIDRINSVFELTKKVFLILTLIFNSNKCHLVKHVPDAMVPLVALTLIY